MARNAVTSDINSNSYTFHKGSLNSETMPGDIPQLLKLSQSMHTDNLSRSQVV